MTTWISQPDPNNPGQWRIVNNANGKTVVYGLSKIDADSFVERRNKQEKKRQKDEIRHTTKWPEGRILSAESSLGSWSKS